MKDLKILKIKKTIIEEILPKLKEISLEAYDTADYVKYNYIKKSINLIENGIYLGDNNNIKDPLYWEAWESLGTKLSNII